MHREEQYERGICKRRHDLVEHLFGRGAVGAEVNHHDGTESSHGLEIVHDLQCLAHRAALHRIHRGTTRRQFPSGTEHDRVANGKHVDELTVQGGGLRYSATDDQRNALVNRRR